MVEYKGIYRELSPEWLGWTIIDLLKENQTAPEFHKNEIQVQLDYEVKLFHYNKNKLNGRI